MGEFISALISSILQIVDGYLNVSVAQSVFKKEGEIQNAVVSNIQERYGNLQNQISIAALEQYQDQLQTETEKKVVAGNLFSVAIAVFMIIMAVLIVYILRK